MATMTINIPDNIATRVIDGIAYRLHYSPTLEDGSPNPETKSQFAKRKLIEHIKKLVKEAEVEQARNTAATTASQSAEEDIVLS